MVAKLVRYDCEGKTITEENLVCSINAGDPAEERVLWVSGGRLIDGEKWFINIDFETLFSAMTDALRKKEE